MYRELIKHHLVAAFIVSFLLCWISEFLLLEVKYDVFSGGFLQIHALTSLQNRLEFLFYSLVFDGAVCATAASLTYAICVWWRVRPLLAAYNFVWLFSACFVGVVAVQYKLFSYFGDALTLEVTRNLGGGSLASAWLYIMDESMLALYVLLVMLVVYSVGYRYVVRKTSFISETGQYTMAVNARAKIRIVVWPLIVTAMTLSMFELANRNEDVRYYLAKKSSYRLLNTVITYSTDFDGDGAGVLGYPRDVGPYDPSVFPGALDIPNNGIDEDGLLGDFVLKDQRFPETAGSYTAEPGKNLVLIVMESGRADMLNKWIAGQEVTPVINALARQGSYFEHVYSHTGYTTSSLKAIFASRPFATHPEPSLFSRLKRQGYEVSVFSGQDESFGEISAVTQMKRNATVFFDASVAPQDRVFASADPASIRLDQRRVVKEVVQRIETADWDKRHFFYINFQDGHFPYNDPNMPMLIQGERVLREQIKPENKKKVESTYWNSIANVDAAIGKVLQAMHTAGALKDTVVVITADHGESLFDDGFIGHGIILNDIQTRIPLVVNIPNMQAPQPMGQDQMAPLIAQWLSDNPNDHNAMNHQHEDVFMLVGELGRPSQIGVVDKDFQRVIYDFSKQAVYFGKNDRWEKIVDIEKSGHADKYGVFARLVTLWEAKRWNAYQDEAAHKQVSRKSHAGAR